MFLSFFCALLGSSSLAVLVKAQGHSGFISIDCEVPSASNDETSDMNYISDATFIETGTSTLSMKFYDIRSIPEGMKNCYTSSPEQAKESKYLIRASFIHGNHDSQSNPPEFDLYNSWDSVKLEIIHMPPSNDVFVCPANTGIGTHGKIEERITFFKVVQSEKQSVYHGYVTGLTPAELMERLKNGSLSLREIAETKLISELGKLVLKNQRQ
ncbi:hypothetical protein QYF36_006379 [Acer negundo]|nr:hypothetical protein QYF36_006379 [Acer negundo]